MKSIALFTLCFFVLAISTFGGLIKQLTGSGPNYSTVIHEVASTNFPISGVIGQENFTNNVNYYSTASTIERPVKLVAIPYNNYTAVFASKIGLAPGTTSLLVIDYDGGRVLLFNNVTATNNPTTNSTQSVAVFVWGQSNVTSFDADVLDHPVSVDYNQHGLYVLSDGTVFFYNFSSVDLASGGLENPDNYFGNCSNCPAYFSLDDDAPDMVVKKSTGEVIVSDPYCSRLVVFSANAGPTTAPNYVVGQSNATNCFDDCDNSQSYTTCLYDPRYIALDPQDNLYVKNDDDNGEVVYFFPVATIQGNATFAIYANSSDTTYDRTFDDCSGLVYGPAPNQITIISTYNAIVIQVGTFLTSRQPTTAHNVLAWGFPNEGRGDQNDYTDSLEDMGGCAYAYFGSLVTVFISDYDNYRVVSFTLNGTVLPSQVLNPTYSMTPTASLSFGATPSTTNTASFSASASLSFGASPSSAPSSTPNYGSFSIDFSISSSSSSSSSLASWLGLIF